jgi:2-polyprenyl-3-methyl-5-hydroxy-6-metoxy-1,4-benzoquinol methylase
MKIDNYSNNQIQFYDIELPSGLLKACTSKPESVVDLGCGDGALLISLYLQKRINYAKEILAVDVSNVRLTRIKKVLPNINTLKLDLNKRLKLHKRYNLVINTQVIEHLKDDRKFLEDVALHTSKKGFLYISSVVKDKNAWWIYKKNGKVTCDPTHLREYASKDEFINLIKKYGFSINEVKISDFRPSLLNGILRFIKAIGILSEDSIRTIHSYSFIKYLNKLVSIKAPGYHIIEVLAQKEK